VAMLMIGALAIPALAAEPNGLESQDEMVAQFETLRTAIQVNSNCKS
jgi:hypothetical protein